MKELGKYSGTLLTATGIQHTLVAWIIAKDVYSEMFHEGRINSVCENPERVFAHWFGACGILLILWGLTLQYYIRKTGAPTPAFIGWALLVFSGQSALPNPCRAAGSYCRRQ